MNRLWKSKNVEGVKVGRASMVYNPLINEITEITCDYWNYCILQYTGRNNHSNNGIFKITNYKLYID